jgi:lipopolysaccharide biosynthesis protein
MIMDTRLIAFYLPQYHPITENNRWWGKGFTEWTNVAKSRPLFPGHYQPHLPADLGYYDLRLPETREAQAELARAYGIHGFCYYYYWFNGRRLLERPLQEVLWQKKPNFPFCVCWANENWTRRWDGMDNEVLMPQRHSSSDDLAFIQGLRPYFEDERYIRVNGKPMLLIYRTNLLPDPARSAELWRETMRQDGIGDIYLVKVESFGSLGNPQNIGFDASVQFPPHHAPQSSLRKLEYNGHKLTTRFVDYESYCKSMLARKEVDFVLHKTALVSFDNTVRKGINGSVFLNSTPKNYGSWIKSLIEEAKSKYPPELQLVFINAWNEWGEGNHLEPDFKYGHQFLEQTKAAIGL